MRATEGEGTGTLLVTMPPVARNSHYVPQALIRRWSADPEGLRVHAYRILVPHAEYPLWESRSISRVAMMRDLYSNGADGREVDDLERRLNEQYETPGLAAVEKVVDEKRLTDDDWHALIWLFAVQNLRTPAKYSHFMDYCDRQIQPVFDSSIRSTVEMLEEAMESGAEIRAPVEPGNELSRSMQLRFTTTPSDEPGKALLKVVMQADRSLWIGSMRHTLEGIANVLVRHRWTILRPHGDTEWPLTDDPGLCLNWYGPGNFDLRGGWDNPRGELLMPLSPWHLLHTEIGQRPSISRIQCTEELTRRFQQVIAAGALRWIYGTQPYDWVTRARPRLVDRERFDAEEREIRDWDENQRAATSGDFGPDSAPTTPSRP